jgi:prophage regulatory protein
MSQRESERRSSQSRQDKNLGKHYYRRWVSVRFLSKYFEVTEKTIWSWSRSGRLPPPVKVGPNCTRWDFEKISADAESAA